MKCGGIYLIRLSETHYYGGRTCDFRTRWRYHKWRLLSGNHSNTFMQNVFNKHQMFETAILEQIEGEDDRLRSEQRWLDANYGSPGCVNLSPSSDSGSTRGVRRTQEVRDKISASLTGRKHSPETLAALREASARRWASTPMSDTTRVLMSKARKGRKNSDSARQKMSDAAKARGGNGPKAHTESTRQKMAESQKARRARERSPVEGAPCITT